MPIKSGPKRARLTGIQGVAVLAYIIASRVMEAEGYDCVLTEATGGKHKQGSKHPLGEAIDLRSKHIPPDKKDMIRKKIKQALGDDYDVLLEHEGTADEHYHIEHDRKGR